uniref:AAA family ATPase n=1 Tax=Pantoea ananas TaxID=553 RepID=UPI001FF0BBD7
LHGDVLMWLMKTLLTSRCINQRGAGQLTREQAFFTANLSRKLLESFLNFKYPKHRSDLSQLMDVAAKGCVAFDGHKKEKVYRFINKYSHSAVIEINEDIAENLIGEGTNVIGDIFSWIEEIDKVHHDEMVSICRPQV